MSLDFGERHRQRIRRMTGQGQEVVLNLPKAERCLRELGGSAAQTRQT